jgi:hypothetical protein
MTSVPRAIPGATAGRLSGRARWFPRLIAPNGSAVLATAATDAPERNCERRLAAITRSLTAHQIPQERALLRLDGQYGTGAVLSAPFWFRFCDAWQRLHGARSSACPNAPAPPTRSTPAADCKVRWYAASTTALECQWGLRQCPAAWWWLPIPPARRRARLASRVRASSLNSSSPTSREPPFAASDVVELYLHRGAIRACSS